MSSQDQNDILRAARHMIERHGRQAAMVSADRARNLARAGQDGAAAIWQEIVLAIREIENKVG